MKQILVGLILLFAYQTGVADEAVDVPPSLWMAKTSGTWKADNGYGFYRVLVFRQTGDHAVDTVEVQIIRANAESDAKQIVNTIQLKTPGYRGYVKDISFTQITEKLMSVSLDIEMKGMDGIVLREVYIVSPDGKVRSIAEADYQDIYE